MRCYRCGYHDCGLSSGVCDFWVLEGVMNVTAVTLFPAFLQGKWTGGGTWQLEEEVANAMLPGHGKFPDGHSAKGVRTRGHAVPLQNGPPKGRGVCRGLPGTRAVEGSARAAGCVPGVGASARGRVPPVLLSPRCHRRAGTRRRQMLQPCPHPPGPDTQEARPRVGVACPAPWVWSDADPQKSLGWLCHRLCF